MQLVVRPERESRTVLLRALAVRGLILACFWFILTEGDTRYWGFALLSIALAALVSLVVLPVGSWRWRAKGLLRFVPYFAEHSLRGGIDVSRRALHPEVPHTPGYVKYRFRLTDEPSRVFFVNAINLLPGTIATQIDGDVLRVHVLDTSMPVAKAMGSLEERVADLFGVDLRDA